MTANGKDTVNMTTGGGSDVVNIGSESAKVSITADKWSITAAGAATFRSA